MVASTLMRSGAIFLALVACLGAPAWVPPAEAATTAAQLRQRQRALQEQAQRLAQKLEAQRLRTRLLRQKEHSAVSELTQLQQKLENTSTELMDSQYRLRRAEAKLGQAQTRLAQARSLFTNQQQSASARLKAIYKTKTLDQWEALLSARDMGTFLTRFHFLKRVSEQDANMLDRLDRQRRVITQEQRRYALQRQNIARITEAIGAQKVQLGDLTQSQNHLVNQIKTERQAAEAAVAQLEADNRQVEGMIRRILAQRAAMEAAARRLNPNYIRPPLGTGRFGWPCAGVITSGFGYRRHPVLGRMIGHHGVDFGAPSGAPIYAADSGEVISVGWFGGYGRAVIIDHGGGVSTLYGHTSATAVGNGQRVTKGQLIAYVGSTGMSTGPHLHFEVRINGGAVNPMGYLR